MAPEAQRHRPKGRSPEAEKPRGPEAEDARTFVLGARDQPVRRHFGLFHRLFTRLSLISGMVCLMWL